MLKRAALIFITIAFFSSLLMGCGDLQSKPQKINEVAKIKYSEVTKIVFSDGRGKNKPFTLEDKKKIKEFIKLMASYVLKKDKEHVDSVGWVHRADLYNGDKNIISITFTKPLEIDGEYYDIVKGQLRNENIDNFIRSANPAWK
ncbi:MAG: hypothetical protein Q8936_24115 [Bacillota bacterium]|nr:hypothetical protein [Bacillota bacterium]